MGKQILYLGDTALKEAASYLAGILTHYKLSFDYLPSDRKFDPGLLSDNLRAVILSDYPAANFTAGDLDRLAKSVEQGMGLLMIGGWESFTGPNREYTHTPLREILPVVMQATDDRINCDQPCLVEKSVDHPIVASLPFDSHPPAIGGFNRFEAKAGGQTILCSRRFSVSYQNKQFSFNPASNPDPLLVVGTFGQGRAVAFASDAAPHWVGGLVDWGDSRVIAQADGGNGIEVGNWYAQLFANLVRWTGNLI